MITRFFILVLVCAAFFGCSSSQVQTAEASPQIVLDEENNQDSRNDVKEKGWSHLLKILVREGINQRKAENALGSREMPDREMLKFNLNPQEKHSIYKGVNTSIKRKQAYEFYLKHKDTFLAAQKRYSVPEGVILAILQVETQCGKFTGNKSVFLAIARLANATDPEIIRENLKNNTKSNEFAVYRRALYLERTFVPHLIATFKIAPNGDVHKLHGSFAGAMGLPQFMPDNILKFGIDANQDGVIDLYNEDDAIFSTANYLKQHGWSALDISYTKKRAVIWEYNHSTPYIDTVLSMAEELQKIISPGQKKSTNVDTKKYPRESSHTVKKLYPGARRTH